MSVDRVLALGDDAHVNQFQAIFPNGLPTGGDSESIALRMDQTFPMPQEVIATYDIDFRGAKIPKSSRKEDTDKKFTVAVRIDQQWKIYDDLRKLHKATYDSATNTAMPELATRFPFVIQALDGTNKAVKTFTFMYSKLVELKPSDFDNSSGDPSRLELTFIYGRLEVT
jgi:hypothetical protein